jgi:hypothetical protein
MERRKGGQRKTDPKSWLTEKLVWKIYDGKMGDMWESLVACTNLHMLRKASANEESSAISQETLMGIGHC